MDLSHRDRVNSLAAKVRALPGYPSFPGVEAGRARYDHMGALLADAALQAAIDFNSVVKPRVQRLLAAWPEADTVARFLVRVRAEGLNQVLGWADAEKPARAVRLADLLTDEGVDTVDELRIWSLLPGSRAKLLKVKGVGEKTADYIAMLAGAPAAPASRSRRISVVCTRENIGQLDEFLARCIRWIITSRLPVQYIWEDRLRVRPDDASSVLQSALASQARGNG